VTRKKVCLHQCIDFELVEKKSLICRPEADLGTCPFWLFHSKSVEEAYDSEKIPIGLAAISVTRPSLWMKSCCSPVPNFNVSQQTGGVL